MGSDSPNFTKEDLYRQLSVCIFQEYLILAKVDCTYMTIIMLMTKI